jgi:hypothetical protein
MAIEPKPAKPAAGDKPAPADKPAAGDKPDDKKADEKKEPEVKLPPEVQALVDELKRIQLKRRAGIDGGMTPDQVTAIDDMIRELGPKIGAALVEDAKREAQAAAEAAAQLVKGPQIATPAPSNDQKRIKDAEDELRRIEDKLAKAKQLGDNDHDIPVLLALLPKLRRALGRAARMAARREADELKAEIDRIAKGLPRPDAGNGNGPGPTPTPSPSPTPSPTPTPAPSGGGGAGSAGAQPAAGGAGGGDSSAGLGAEKETAKSKQALTLYVRSDKTIWAWDRAAQDWVGHSFTSEIVDVKLISGGILAIAKHEAVLWDTFFGRWLTPLKVPSEDLTKGDASTADGKT